MVLGRQSQPVLRHRTKDGGSSSTGGSAVVQSTSWEGKRERLVPQKQEGSKERDLLLCKDLPHLLSCTAPFSHQWLLLSQATHEEEQHMTAADSGGTSQ